MEINRNDWFKTLVGITETEWIQNPILKGDLNMGEFVLLSIAELTHHTF